MAWKNGGGVTHELAVYPAGADLDGFSWRLSLAEVAADGPFSVFPGIDRTLTLLAGDGMTLDFGGGAVTLAPGSAPLSFPGEARVDARLTGGPILDLNVMTRRARMTHQLITLGVGDRTPDGAVALVAREPSRVMGFDLGQGEALMLDGATAPHPVERGEILALTVQSGQGGGRRA